MPTIPYPLVGETLEDLRTECANLFQDIYENGIGGAEVGDTFSTQGDILTLRLYDEGGLEKVNNQLTIKLAPDSGLQLSSAGLQTIVSQGSLSTSSGSVGGSPGNYELPGGEYGFYPQTKGINYSAWFVSALTLESYATYIYLSGGTTPYAQQRYITASGELFWIFLMRDKDSGKIVAKYQAPDHPCFGNGGDPLLNPHPFPFYDEKKHEMIVINPSCEQVAIMKSLCRSPRMGIPPKDLLELFDNQIEINEKEEREYDKKPITVATIKDEDMRPVWMQKDVRVVKMRILQPDYIKVRTIKNIRTHG